MSLSFETSLIQRCLLPFCSKLDRRYQMQLSQHKFAYHMLLCISSPKKKKEKIINLPHCTVRKNGSLRKSTKLENNVIAIHGSFAEGLSQSWRQFASPTGIAKPRPPTYSSIPTQFLAGAGCPGSFSVLIHPASGLVLRSKLVPGRRGRAARWLIPIARSTLVGYDGWLLCQGTAA